MNYCLTLPNTIVPSKKHENDCCWDLFTPCSFILKVGKIETINIGFKCQLPPYCHAIIKGKSKLARLGIQILGGVIDNNYIGDWGVVMYNCGEKDIFFNIGDPIAQFYLMTVAYPNLIFDLVESLSETDRGISGIWSEPK